MATTCTICFQKILAANHLITDCGHSFCSNCILTWANKSDRNADRRFHCIGLIPKDPIPIVSCPLCRKEVRSYKTSEGSTIKIQYQYQGNPYQLQVGGLVYYYQRLRQPGGKRAGSIGILKEIQKNIMIIQCVWPDHQVSHQVRSYCVFDILSLGLFGSIPTRSQINQYFVADHLGSGFITECAYQFGPKILSSDLVTIQQLLRQHNSSQLISPLCSKLLSVDFFLQVVLMGAIVDSSILLRLKQLPNPVNNVNLQPYFEQLQTHSIGLNQARVILAYHDKGCEADEDDTPIVLKLLGVASS